MLKKLLKKVSITLSVVFSLGISPICANAATVNQNHYDLQEEFIDNNAQITNAIHLTDKVRNEINKKPSVNVGVIDFFPTNSYMNSDNCFTQLINGNQDYPDESHGTEVTQTIFAVNPNVNLYAYNLDFTKYDDMVDAYTDAITTLVTKYNVNIINISSAFKDYNIAANGYVSKNGKLYSQDEINKANDKIEVCLQNLLRQGHDFLIVKGAGNQSHNKNINKNYNGENDIKSTNIFNSTSTGTVNTTWDIFSGIETEELKSRIIVVAGSNENNILASFSNYDYRVDVIAPATNFKLFTVDKENENQQGTSFSTPLVTGLASAVKAENSKLTCPEIKSLILNNATDAVKDYNYQTKDLSQKLINIEKTINECFDIDFHTLNNNIKLEPTGFSDYIPDTVKDKNDMFWSFNCETDWMKAQTLTYNFNGTNHNVTVQDCNGFFNVLLDNKAIVERSATIRAITKLDLNPNDNSQELVVYYYGINQRFPFTLIISFNDNNYSIVTRTNDYICLTNTHEIIGFKRSGDIIDTDSSVKAVGKYAKYGYSELYFDSYDYQNNTLQRSSHDFIGYIY